MLFASLSHGSSWKAASRVAFPSPKYRYAHVVSSAQERQWRPPFLQELEDVDDVVSSHLEQHLKPQTSLNDSETRGDQHLDEAATEWTRQSPSGDRLGQLRDVMAANDPDKLLLHLWQARNDFQLFQGLPRTTFSEILRRIQPHSSFMPLGAQYKALGPEHYFELSAGRHNFYRALSARRRMYRDIIESRMRHRRLRLNEYVQMLNMTRATWDGTTAKKIMRDMVRDDIEPNLTCYNYYFEARCWSDTLAPEERHTLRVIPFNEERRLQKFTKETKEGHVIDGHITREEGIRWEISRLFTKMIRDGITPNTQSYMHLITAQAREGDIKGVQSVLKEVWNTDTAALAAGRLTPADMPEARRDSPTYPNGELLFVIAHAFGTNNDIPTALRVIDHISMSFDVPIPQLVWQELLEWTHVLTKKRNVAYRSGGRNTGKLPAKSMESLWQVMKSELYNGKPTLLMYDFMVRHHYREDHFFKALRVMQEGLKLHEDKYTTDSSFLKEYRRQARNAERNFDPLVLSSDVIKAEEENFSKWVAYFIIHRWFRYLLNGGRWNVVDTNNQVEARTTIWQRQMLPDVVREFWRFKGLEPIRYRINSGWISLKDPNEHDLARENFAIFVHPKTQEYRTLEDLLDEEIAEGESNSKDADALDDFADSLDEWRDDASRPS